MWCHEAVNINKDKKAIWQKCWNKHAYAVIECYTSIYSFQANQEDDILCLLLFYFLGIAETSIVVVFWYKIVQNSRKIISKLNWDCYNYTTNLMLPIIYN